MIRLQAVGVARGVTETILGTVERLNAVSQVRLVGLRSLESKPSALANDLLLTTAQVEDQNTGVSVSEINSVDHLSPGDIVAVHPSGRIDTLFRIGSQNNSLFATERCNSRCLMCSQPPRDVNDIDYRGKLNAALVSLLPESLPTLGLTGGEPTLLGERLVELIRLVVDRLPNTQFEILSNGRALANTEFTAQIGEAASRGVIFSVPLYADYAPLHDFVVQAKGAFNETVLGLHNLARFEIRCEIRVVLHKQTVPRLRHLVEFIQRNLPFVEHVALMGMEHVGYARMHDDLLWADPLEYADLLRDAVEYLTDFGYPTSIYNLQHCLVSRDLWPHLRVSISDWKREYLHECDRCRMRDNCGGVFGTSKRQSANIQAITVG